MQNAGVRLSSLGLLIAAFVAVWQTYKLESWGFDGPGAGFFPQLVSAVCVALAALTLAFPGRPAPSEDGDEVEGTDWRNFFVYCIAFGVMAAGSFFAGFAITTIVATVVIVRFGEGRSWARAVTYGVVCAVIGLVCFGWLLRVDIPESPVERTFYSFVR